MIKILILSPTLPWPLNMGGNVAMFHLLQPLSRVYDITFVSSLNEMNTFKKLAIMREKVPQMDFELYDFHHAKNKKYELLKKIQRRVDQRVRFGEHAFKWDLSCINEVTPDYIDFICNVISQKKIDLVQIEFWQYLPLVYALPDNVKKVFIHHELRYVINDTRFNIFDNSSVFLKKYLKDFEISALNRYDAVVTLSSIDKKKLENEDVKTNVFVSPCVISDKVPDYKENYFNGNIVFVGGSTHLPNKQGIRWFAEKVVPHLKTLNFDFNLKVVGNWSQEAKNEIHEFSANIDYMGFVDNLPSILSNSIMIVPINLGSGIRMKIFEAAMHSTPIITTSVGVEGIEFENGKDCIIEDNPLAFAQKIVDVANNPELYRKLAQSAYKTFMDKYSPNALISTRISVYNALLNND